MGASVLIVDDHPGFRAQARRMLESEGYRVVGEAGDAASDVYLPDGNGFEVAARLAGLDAPPAVVLTSSHDGAEFAHCLSESGARGFVPKTELSGEAIEVLLE